jgi:protein-S-isoprenylcysteine O-methyltransferase Ste14
MMAIQYYLSVLLFILFVACVACRAAMLRRKGIEAIVFGDTDKTDFLLIPFVLLIVYAVLANAFGLPLWKPLVRPFWIVPYPGWVGIVLCTLALVIMILSLVSFGNSFRVGIDEQKADELVTTGMFAISRNPIYVSFNLFFTGQFLVHRNIMMLLSIVCFALLIHRQILREEKFLKSHYGADYADYCRKVRRYL